jgi:hypothetical protein
MPVAAKEAVDLQGRELLISIDIRHSESYTLRRIRTRLVVTARPTEESHSVFGQIGEA